MQTFWDKHKVFLIGLLSALVLTLEQFINQPTVDWKAIGLAAVIAILSYFARTWRGQTGTIVGIVGTASAALATELANGDLAWDRLILQITVAIIAGFVSDAKSRGYEHTDTIKQAKAEGETIVPAQFTEKAKV